MNGLFEGFHDECHGDIAKRRTVQLGCLRVKNPGKQACPSSFEMVNRIVSVTLLRAETGLCVLLHEKLLLPFKGFQIALESSQAIIWALNMSQ